MLPSDFMIWVNAECRKDPAAQLAIEWCEALPEAVGQLGFQIIADHLWRVTPVVNPICFRLYIPNCRSLKRHVLLESHISASGGHGDRNSTYDAASRRTFWPDLLGDVETFVSECADCQGTPVPVPVPVPVPLPATARMRRRHRNRAAAAAAAHPPLPDRPPPTSPTSSAPISPVVPPPQPWYHDQRQGYSQPWPRQHQPRTSASPVASPPDQ